MLENIFVEFSLLIIIAAVISIIMYILKQPLIIGYLITGIIVSPYFLNIARSSSAIEGFASFGIALLLFMVGLNLNLKIIKDVGKIAVITGLGQVFFTSIFGYLIAIWLGISNIAAIYVAVALTFSSTIIIMKLLSDKGDLDSLYGRISVGFLIVQDFVVVIILLFVASSSNTTGFGFHIFETIFKILGMLIILFLISYFCIPKCTKFIAKSQELLLLFSLSWAFAISTLFHVLNFSMEIGALLAGVTLAMSPYRYEISSKMKPIRDFFLILFFVYLGTQMTFSNINQFIIPIIVLSIFILIGNPLIVIFLMGRFGYTKRNSFFCGLTVAQISEFSLILIAVGVREGAITGDIMSMVTVIGLITITASSYMILYANKIYPYFSKILSVFEKKGKKVDEQNYKKAKSYDIILFGANRTGHSLLSSFKKLKKKFLVVDYNPDKIAELAKLKYDCKYGDVGDSELLNELDLNNTKMVVSTIPDIDSNLMLVTKIRETNQKNIIIVLSNRIENAVELYEKGATYVIMPHFLGGHHASAMIEKHNLNINKFIREKANHLNYLKERSKK